MGGPFPSPGDLPDPGIEPGSPALQVDSLLFKSGEYICMYVCMCVCHYPKDTIDKDRMNSKYDFSQFFCLTLSVI